MKVLFDHDTPFQLAHGGFQIQIERTRTALESIGIEVDYLRWWDPDQKADLIQYFGRPHVSYIRFAHAKGMKVVMAELLTGTGSRTPAQLRLQRLMIRVARRLVPGGMTLRLAWDAYQLADAIVALTGWERQLMIDLYNAPAARVHVVPNGVEALFLDNPSPPARGPWLVCTAVITERKRVLELAEAAARAQTPLWIIGKAYGEDDPYYRRFLEVARQHPDVVRFEGPVQDRPQLARIYREARGFVQLSTMESLSLSALEAAACGCPLLLSDLPWARSTFQEQACFCPVDAGTHRTAKVLRAFYDEAPGMKPPRQPMRWDDVARQLRSVYEGCLKG